MSGGNALAPNRYHAQLEIQHKGRAIKGLVVSNDWNLVLLDLLNGPALGCFQPSPEVLFVLTMRIQKIFLVAKPISLYYKYLSETLLGKREISLTNEHLFYDYYVRLYVGHTFVTYGCKLVMKIVKKENQHLPGRYWDYMP